MHAVTSGVLRNISFRHRFVDATNDDKSMKILESYITNGFPTKRSSCVEPLKPFWNVRHQLTCHDGLILRNNQIVVPTAMRKTILADIHKGHLGISKCIERAKNAVYWPGYLSMLTDLISSCEICAENSRANSGEYIEPYPVPDYPMQTIHMDVSILMVLNTWLQSTATRNGQHATCFVHPHHVKLSPC